ncbi:MAG TPA: DNA-3-methyladenine glycosylase I, partial [Chloroflexota bacterium]|nr:DNA-3-methyladenine glycosylase I [Chloroflexota bacterium]
MTDLIRCDWANSNALMVDYHDREWGTPTRDDRLLFEHLVLEAAQAGLSWSTVLNKRAAYRVAFDAFDPILVAEYDDAKIAELLANPGIIRNRLKIKATVANARAFLRIQAEVGSFADYLWRYVDGKPIRNRPTTLADLPAKSALSDTLSKDLKSRGFSFVGSTSMYAFLQAVGVIDDHIAECFRADPTPRPSPF